jgi:hypothetical protein
MIFTAENRITVHGTRYTEHGTRNPELEIDISHLASGIYFLKVGNEVVKVVKR